MDSVLNNELGTELYNQLSELCQLFSKASIHARKCWFNLSNLLEHIPLQDRKAEVVLDSDQLPCAKTLSVIVGRSRSYG